MRHFDLVRVALLSAVLPVVACHHESPPERVTTLEVAPHLDLALPPAPKVAPETPPVVAEEETPPDDLVARARALLEGNDTEGALVLAKQAVLETPDRWTAWNTLGRAQLRHGQNDAALDSFEQAVETGPGSAWAHNNFGLTLINDARYEEAVAQLEQATKLAPSNGIMWNNLGVAYEHVDRVEDARGAYRQAMYLEHDGGAKNFVRIEGVHSHTAKIDVPVEDPGL
jgi:Tfp pilus assembly protein PilF